MDDSTTIDVETAQGPARWHYAPAAETEALLVMGHGAGGGVDATDLAVLAARLPALGIAVARFEQPWRVAGKKVAGPPAKLDAAWNAALPRLLADATGGAGNVPVFLGGRSAGARVACRTAPEFEGAAVAGAGIAGVVCAAFPLHPPGRPERSRADELLRPTVPRLLLQGERDSFGSPHEVDAACDTAAVRVVGVPGADHTMHTTKKSGISADDVADRITDTVAAFCRGRE